MYGFLKLAGLYKTEEISLEVYYDGNPEYNDLIKQLNSVYSTGIFESVSKYLSRVAFKEEDIFNTLWDLGLIGIKVHSTDESFHTPEIWYDIEI